MALVCWLFEETDEITWRFDIRSRARGPYGYLRTYKHAKSVSYIKKMVTVILPQYLANLTQPIGMKKAICFCESYLVLATLCVVGLELLERFCAFFGDLVC